MFTKMALLVFRDVMIGGGKALQFVFGQLKFAFAEIGGTLLPCRNWNAKSNCNVMVLFANSMLECTNLTSMLVFREAVVCESTTVGDSISPASIDLDGSVLSRATIHSFPSKLDLTVMSKIPGISSARILLRIFDIQKVTRRPAGRSSAARMYGSVTVALK
jgi:hypothetical protein